MSPVKIPTLRAAMVPKRVATPRFNSNSNSKAKKKTTLTEAVLRVLARAQLSPSAFAVFAVGGCIVISQPSTDRCKSLQRQKPETFIGTYQRGVKVADLLDDMQEHFSDEVAEVV